MTNKTIKFTPAQEGHVIANVGKSALSNSFFIGAMALTAKEKIQDGDVVYQYPTDQAGIEQLQLKIDGYIESLADAISAITVINTFVDETEVGSELHSINWLLCGLSESIEIASNQSAQLRKSEPLIITEGLEK